MWCIYALAYLNRYANFLKFSGEMPVHFTKFEHDLATGRLDEKTLFYASIPEKTEEELCRFPLHILHNVATGGPLFIYEDVANRIDEDTFRRFLALHPAYCEERTRLSCSEHGLIIAQKRE